MEERKYQYDAFISYRHLPDDKRVAVRLQQLLERHKITEKGEGAERRRPLRIFRDRSELPTSGELGEDIRRALEQSRYLIVVCSKQLCASRWCMKEIEIFRSIHGMSNFHILPLLIEGEPDESFPEALRRERRTVTDAAGKEVQIEVEVEPLGADVRARSAGGMLRRLRREYLRIAAPILGCAYDDLYRRGQRRAFRRAAAVSAAVLAAAAAVSVYSIYMLKQIAAQQEGLYRTESLRLAELAEQKTEAGEYREAMLLAQEALPDDLDDPERPLVEEAVTALRSAVTQQTAAQDSEALVLQARIEFNVDAWMPARTCADGEKIVATDFNNTYLYDARTGALLFSCTGAEVSFNDAGSRAVRVTEQYMDGGVQICLEGFRTDGDGEPYFAAQYEFEEGEKTQEIFGVWDEDSGACYVVRQMYEEGEGVWYEPVERYDAQGKAAEADRLPDQVLKRCEAYSSEYYMDSELSNVAKNANYYAGEWNESYAADSESRSIVEATERHLENAGLPMYAASVSADGRLIVMELGTGGGTLLFAAVEEKRVIDIKSGSCGIDRSSGLLYIKNGTALEIYSYVPENFAYAGAGEDSAPQTYREVSGDGTKGLTMTVTGDTEGGTEYVRLTLRDLENGQSILTEAFAEADSGRERYLYFVTPDLERIFYKEPGGPFRLCSSGGECLLEFENETGEEATAVAADRSGERTAAAFWSEERGSRVEVRGASDGSLLRELEFDAEAGAVTHMELQDARLLVCTHERSWIVDLEGEEETEAFAGGNQSRNRDGFLTEGGLLFCTQFTNTPYTLNSIYDVRSGERVFEGTARSWRYDEASGILAYQEMSYSGMNSEVRLAQRKADGKFEDFCTIRPEGLNVTLPTGLGRHMDGEYLLLTGPDSCEVYRTDSGEKALVLAGSSYALVNGEICDARVREGRKPNRYPVLGAKELKARAEEFLTSESGLRKLTEREKEKYFIT